MATSSFVQKFYVSKKNSNEFVNALTAPVAEQKKNTDLPPMATEEDLRAIARALAKNSNH